jgi:hypothetical protein
MRNKNDGTRLRGVWSVAFLITLSLLTTATASRIGRVSVAGITVANNSGLEIRHLYLSPVDQDNWGPDQLNNSTIASGASFTLNDVACAQGSIKVIAEDLNGCFFYKTTNCTDNVTWTIESNATPDCGN